MNEPLKSKEKHYTYADYLTWGDEVRYELIDGVPYLLAAPTPTHQRISSRLQGKLFIFWEGKPCEVFAAPFDVRLNAEEDDDTVVQPDLLILCDRDKLDDKGCVGAPDMVIEILSPSSLAQDRVIKLNQYLQAGVREYWIVDPDGRTVSVHLLKDAEYIIRGYVDTDSVPVYVLDGCVINLSEVFAE